MSGSSDPPMTWTLPHGAYYVAVKHRNHLGAMTATPVYLDSNTTTLDFTAPSFQTWGNQAQCLQNGVNLLWAGNANWDWSGPPTIKYTGLNNDRDGIIQALGGNPTATVATAYFSSLDVNMDGVVKYIGANNDRDLILNTVGGVANGVRTEQVP